jgi:hypothetical protein
MLHMFKLPGAYNMKTEIKHTVKPLHWCSLYFQVQEDGKIFITQSLVISTVHLILLEWSNEGWDVWSMYRNQKFIQYFDQETWVFTHQPQTPLAMNMGQCQCNCIKIYIKRGTSNTQPSKDIFHSLSRPHSTKKRHQQQDYVRSSHMTAALLCSYSKEETLEWLTTSVLKCTLIDF